MKQICIAGRLGKTAELRRTQSGDPVLGFSVAVDDGYGQNKRTIWFDCSVWGKRAEALKDMLPKGKEVTVTGDLSTREYDGKTYLTVRVAEIALHGGRDLDRQESDPARSEKGMSDRDDPRTGGGSYSDTLSDDIPFAPEWR